MMRTGAGRSGADATLGDMVRPRPSRLTPRTFARALDALAARDADLGRLREEWGAPPLRLRPAGFSALLRVIVDQQLSVASARAIWGRLEERVRPMTPEAFLGERSQALKAAGLSRAKIAYARGLAEEIQAGRLDLESLGRLDDESAIERLVSLKGIGRWSAEIYLLSALARPDVFPADDLAIQTAVARAKGLDGRPDRATLVLLAEPWRPWRSVAARLLWHYFRAAIMGAARSGAASGAGRR